MMTRKDLLLKSAFSAALFIADGITPSADCLSGLFASEESADGRFTYMPPVKKQILQNATLAPSGHNAQPWTVKAVSAGQWIIGWDKARSLPAVDPHNRELVLSIGAFCEAISIAAKSEGFDCKKKVIGTSPFSPELVKISFTASDKSGTLMNALKKRRTLKNGMLSDTINADDMGYIRKGTGCDIYSFSRGSSEAALIEDAVLESNIIQAHRDDAQRELAQWIRWNDKDALNYSNGLTPAGMEIDGFGGWFVKHFYSSEDVMTEQFREQTIKMVKKALSSYGAWIIIASDNDKPVTLIDTGADFLRLGLNAYNRKISLHPMTQPLEEKGFSADLERKLKIQGNIQFILRCGYVENYPDPVTRRMPMESILI